jgi:serine/threonine-protein kinase
MSFSTIADLSAALKRGRLLDDIHAERAMRLLAAGDDPRAIARELVKQGMLTPYQANELFLGRGHALTIGAYVLLEKLGEGGMGVVFKARHSRLGRITAVKIIRPDHLSKPEAVRRFRREMRAVAQLDHPNLVRAYDADEIDGKHLLVMEFVEGTTLSRLIQDHGPLSPSLACEYIAQAASGLQHAFERGLIHRDVKPSNLLLCKTGESSAGKRVKLLDLGLARFAFERDGTSSYSGDLTYEGTAIGTADFMAPEQTEDARSVDIRADVYSLGCTLYYLLCGKPPFSGGSLVEKMLRHRYDTPTPLADERSGLSPRLLRIVDRLLAKQPAYRYQTPAELAQALREIEAKGEEAGAESVQPVPARADDPSAETPNQFRDINAETPVPPVSRQPRTRRSPVVVGVCLAGLGLGILLLLARRTGDEEQNRNDPPKSAPDRTLPKGKHQADDISPKQ